MKQAIRWPWLLAAVFGGWLLYLLLRRIEPMLVDLLHVNDLYKLSDLYREPEVTSPNVREPE